MFCVKRIEILSDLPLAQRQALCQALMRGIIPKRIGTEDRHEVHPLTVIALEEKGLLLLTGNRKKRPTWRPTEEGKRLAMTHEPKLLRRGYGYTPRNRDALIGEPEAA
jgi:hypothetical protein